MNEILKTVRRLDSNDVPRVVDVLVESFFDYPVMRFVLGPDTEDYEGQLRALIHFFVMTRIHRNEILLGFEEEGNLWATALVSWPSEVPSPKKLGKLREQLWTSLGQSARSRYEAFGKACTKFQVKVPHFHLNMIGVRQVVQGQGLGRQVIEAVHQISMDDPTSEGVTLTTEHEANISLYKHLGYEVLGQANVSPTLTTWGLFRANK